MERRISRGDFAPGNKRFRVLNPRGRKGVNRFRLGRLGKAGRYRVRVRAVDAAGNASRRKSVRFRVRG